MYVSPSRETNTGYLSANGSGGLDDNTELVFKRPFVESMYSLLFIELNETNTVLGVLPVSELDFQDSHLIPGYGDDNSFTQANNVLYAWV